MRCFTILSPEKVALVALLTFSLVVSPTAFAKPERVPNKSPVKLQKWSGTIDFSTEETSTFTLAGTASHLGKFSAYGEVDFFPGDEEGALIGEGAVVFEAANGDLLVGIVMWEADIEEGGLRTSHVHFSWSDSVEFNDGTVVDSTGRFEDDRPPGLVVIAIIAILIGLLVPAVQ